VIVLALMALAVPTGRAAEPSTSEILFRNVRVFDGRSTALSSPTSVLVRGNRIAAIGAGAVPANPAVTIIDGGDRTLMPGLIDAHVHIMFATIPQLAVLTSDIGFVNVAAAKAANDMLLRGFTSIRDLGGPVFGLKQGIDAGLVAGPHIWPSGAFISQSGGHGDFRLPNDMPARPGDFTYSERVGAAAIADDPDTIRKRVREQLALGASQIKLMAGGVQLRPARRHAVHGSRASGSGRSRGELGHLHHRARLHAAGRAAVHRGRRAMHRSRPIARRRHGKADGRERHLVEPAAVRG
jgi:imidazolonepropionase-like amidohydrolase